MWHTYHEVCDALELENGHIVYSDSEEDHGQIHHFMTAELSCNTGYDLSYLTNTGCNPSVFVSLCRFGFQLLTTVYFSRADKF